MYPGAIEDIIIHNSRSQFETNFFALVGFTRKVFPLMIRKEGEGMNCKYKV
jgi:short-subunit dehydrogenase